MASGCMLLVVALALLRACCASSASRRPMAECLEDIVESSQYFVDTRRLAVLMDALECSALVMLAEIGGGAAPDAQQARLAQIAQALGSLSVPGDGAGGPPADGPLGVACTALGHVLGCFDAHLAAGVDATQCAAHTLLARYRLLLNFQQQALVSAHQAHFSYRQLRTGLDDASVRLERLSVATRRVSKSLAVKSQGIFLEANNRELERARAALGDFNADTIRTVIRMQDALNNLVSWVVAFVHVNNILVPKVEQQIQENRLLDDGYLQCCRTVRAASVHVLVGEIAKCPADGRGTDMLKADPETELGAAVGLVKGVSKLMAKAKAVYRSVRVHSAMLLRKCTPETGKLPQALAEKIAGAGRVSIYGAIIVSGVLQDIGPHWIPEYSRVLHIITMQKVELAGLQTEAETCYNDWFAHLGTQDIASSTAAAQNSGATVSGDAE